MCLAVPAEVVSLDENTAQVDIAGNRRECLVDLVPQVQVGDFVLMHAGFAIQIISREDAEETMQLLKEAYGDEEISLSEGAEGI